MNSFSASQEISCTTWKVQNHIHKRLLSLNLSHDKCPSNHSMLPQVADGGTASRYVQQLQTADKGLFSNLGVGQGANNYSL